MLIAGRRRVAAVGLLLLFGLGFCLVPERAVAAEPVVCPRGYSWDDSAMTCLISVSDPGGGEESGGGSGGGSSSGGSSGGGVAKCYDTSLGSPMEVPCSTSSGYWSASRRCYVSIASPQPPTSDPIWLGHTDGAIYVCTRIEASAAFRVPFWSATMPPGLAAPPDPADIAQDIVTSMRLRAIHIGMIPEEKPGSMGIVGLPAWMWVDSPSEQTYGPMTRSASAAGTTVTATAKVTKVLWQMGDGGAVTCYGTGTIFTDGHGGHRSPDCGYTYTEQGTYTVRATAHWTVAWRASTGASGTIPIQLTSSRILMVGELQVVRN